MEDRLRAFEAEMRTMKLPEFVAEFTYRMDEDSNMYYEAVIFESREAYRANAESPEQDTRYRKLLALLEAPPEWHDGDVVSSIFPQ